MSNTNDTVARIPDTFILDEVTLEDKPQAIFTASADF